MMARRSLLLLPATALLALLPASAWSAPAAYKLVVATGKPTLPGHIAGLLERNLPRTAIVAMPAAERYRRYAGFPVPACSGTEYFLLAHGQRLIAFGCLDKTTAAAALQNMRRALARDRATLLESNTEALYDGALASAAAGDYPAARRYVRAAVTRGAPRAEFALRLQRLPALRP